MAAAATVIVAIGLFLGRDGRAPDEPVPGPQLVAQSPAKMVSMMSLRMTYQQGGLDALDRQFRDTLTTLGPGPSSLSMGQLLNGSNSF